MKVTLFETLDEKQRSLLLAVVTRTARDRAIRLATSRGKRTAQAFSGRDVFVLTNRGWV